MCLPSGPAVVTRADQHDSGTRSHALHAESVAARVLTDHVIHGPVEAVTSANAIDLAR